MRITAEDVARARRIWWTVAHQIRDCERSGYYPAIRGPRCGLYGGCDYLDLCWTGEERGYTYQPDEFDGAKI